MLRTPLIYFISALFLLQPFSVLAQGGGTNTRVYLTDGNVVMGELIERTEDLIIIRDADGEVFTFGTMEVNKIVTLDSLGGQAKTVTVTEFPYISFLGGTVALGLISWLQFDTASDRDREATLNRENGILAKARDLRDKSNRARLLGWGSAILALGSLGVSVIPKKKTKRVFPELTLHSGGSPQLGVVYQF
ncbi:MAG: hypothetical protein VX733_02535 [Candidatus Latescibacterota bacterium]|nr:hypothetical protein [Candidatus Latescibacterota bacterium]